MIPITTIHDFLIGKTKEYTKESIKASKSFRDFIRISQMGERSKDIINDANIRTVSLKKYGLKFIEKSEGTQSFLYSMNMTNLGESSVNYGCFALGGAWGLTEIDEKLLSESAKRYKRETTTVTGKTGNKYRIDTFRSLISNDNYDKVIITDLNNSCEASISYISLTKHKKQIDQVISFFTSGLTVKKPQKKPNQGFHTTTFSIQNIPTGISLMEFPGYGGEDSIMLGYFSSTTNTGETFDTFSHREKDTIDAYFLDSSSYLDDTTTQSTDYSYDAYKRLYEKEYTGDGYSNANFSLTLTKNGKKVLIGTVDYKGSISNTTYQYIVFAYPYVITRDGKKEYHELTYSNGYK